MKIYSTYQYTACPSTILNVHVDVSLVKTQSTPLTLLSANPSCIISGQDIEDPVKPTISYASFAGNTGEKKSAAANLTSRRSGAMVERSEEQASSVMTE
jgi:hypothetical protein